MSSNNNIFNKYPCNQKQFIIPIAQDIQMIKGYLSMLDIIQLSEHVGSFPSEVFSVLSFYPQFRFKTKGKYHIEICNQNICRQFFIHERIKYIENIIGIKIGETSPDLIFSFDTGMCKGICKPHIRINGNIFLINQLSDIKDIIYLKAK
jgi:NADH-quinone oxidoreductase subunit E